VIYSLLGELRIGRDGQFVRLPGGPPLLILAALLISVNRQMSKADLLRVAWGTDTVDEAQLYKRMKEVRGLLAQIGRDGDIQTHHGFGYELRLADDDVDLLRFQQLVREAQLAALRANADDEIASLREALGLWRGPRPLSNVPGEAFHSDLERLEGRHRRAAARLFELELERDNHEQVLDQLIQLADYYPDDQRLCEQLMIAQYRCGRVVDVGRAYERHLQALASETGGQPDPLLRNFHFAVARGDQAGAISAEEAITQRRRITPPAPTPRQLPRPEDLVGRDQRIADITRLLRQPPGQAVPVIVVSGPGGIGKTGLVLRAAHESAGRYPDGQLFAELRGTEGPVADTAEVLAQFLRALGVTRVPETKAERLATYRTMLAERSMLIVLDDAADGAQVADLVPNSAGCSVLVTARQRLPDLSGAHHVAPLTPLAGPDATELFLRVVSGAGVGLPSMDHVSDVVSLCGGLPLALRIAGALRVRDHPQPTAALAQRLASAGPDAFAYGEQSVARTIGAGLERLDAPARDLFLWLGMLPLGRFGHWTAAALLAGTDADPMATLAQLASRFMITSAESGTQYGLHDLTREYARRRAEAERPGEVISTAGRAYQALLTLTRRAHAGLYKAEFDVVHSGVPDWDPPPEVAAEVEADPLAWFEAERENLRAAVEHSAALGMAGVCWDLAVSAHEFYTIRGYYDDWQVTHATALAACLAAGDLRGQGMVLTCRNQPALVTSRRADDAGSLAELEQAVGLLADCGDEHGQAVALRTLANALRRRGFLGRPLDLFQRALDQFAACGDRVGWWQAKRFIGQTYLDLGEPAEALRALGEAEAVASQAGWTRLLAQTRYWIGQACLASPADHAAAQVAFDAVYDIFGEDDGLSRAYALHGMGDMARHQGALDIAERYLAEAAVLAREGADATLEGRIRLSEAALRSAQGRPGDQVEALAQATAVFAEFGLAYLEARALAELARARTCQGETAEAEAAWQRLELLTAELPEEDLLQRRPEPADPRPGQCAARAG
jgi:DNA-binding SARP family transcriptional activator